MLQLFSMIKSEDGIKRRGDFFWSVVDFSFEKDTIGHIFTGQYYGLHNHSVLCWLLYIISIDYYSEVSDMVMVFNATFNYISVISWRSILLMVETGVPVKNHRPTANHWQTLLHNTSRLSRIRIHNVSGNIHWLHR